MRRIALAAVMAASAGSAGAVSLLDSEAPEGSVALDAGAAGPAPVPQAQAELVAPAAVPPGDVVEAVLDPMEAEAIGLGLTDARPQGPDWRRLLWSDGGVDADAGIFGQGGGGPESLDPQAPQRLDGR